MKYIKNVGIKNFFSYGSKESIIDLTGTGITNISGSNGVGKSTIVEATIFALYGKTRQETVKDVVNRAVGKDCKVSVEFVGDDDEVYKVIRYRAHSVHGDKVYLFKGEKDISCKNISDTNEEIIDIFGLPYVAYVNSTVFSTEFYSNFFAAKNSDRLNIFENILSLKEISYFYAEIKNVLKEIAEKENEIKLRLTESETKEKSAQGNLDNYSSQAKVKLLSLKTEKEEAQKVIDKLQKELSELETIDVNSEKAKLSNLTLKEEYNKQIKEKEALLKELSVEDVSSEEQKLISQFKDFDFESNKKKESLFKEFSETIKVRESGVDKFKLYVDNSISKIGSLNSEKSSYEKELTKQEEDLKKIQEAICPYCGQVMEKEETDKKRELVEKKISSLKNEISGVEEEIKEEKVSLEEHRKNYSDLLNDISSLKEKLDKDFVPNSDLVEEKYLNAKKHYKEVSSKKEESAKKEEVLNKEISSLKEKSVSLEISKYSEDYLNSIEEQVKEKNKIIEENNLKITSINGMVKSVYDKDYVETLKKQIEDFKVEKEKVQEELKAVEDDRIHYEYLGECCSNKSTGFKKFFIGEMIPVFNEKINQYLPFFFNDKKIEVDFDKDLNDVLKLDGKEITFASLSCGQKTRMEIAAAFALFSLSRIFFSNQNGLLVVDELLDRGLDEYGIKSAISILETFAEDTKVFVISHNPVVKENINDVIEIRRDENGFSYYG